MTYDLVKKRQLIAEATSENFLVNIWLILKDGIKTEGSRPLEDQPELCEELFWSHGGTTASRSGATFQRWNNWTKTTDKVQEVVSPV